MNLPNRITLARILLIPVYLYLMAVLDWEVNWVAAIVFVLASLTDWLDGYLARRREEITDFGKFIDPIADKMLILLPMIQLLWMGAQISVWAVLLMVAREICISGFRLVAAGKGVVIAADMSGKLKTFVQVFAVLCLTLGIGMVGYVLTWIAAILSVASGVSIIVRHWNVLEEAE